MIQETIINMTDDQIIEIYYDMCSLSIKDTKIDDYNYFILLTLEMAKRFAKRSI